MLKDLAPLASPPKTPITGSPSGAVCVLGMHRSGTSCLAGSLEEAGLAFGEEINQEAPFNLKGNRENPRIMDLHQDLLASNGGDWHSPPTRVEWTREYRDRRDQILASYRDFSFWGFKDPRTLLFLEGWREVLPNLRCVGTFRHPLAVAKSLHARDKFPLEQGIELWTDYNQLLLRYQAELGFDVISFDRPPGTYRARLSEITRRLGLDPPRQGFTFFESKLRHNSAERSDSVSSETGSSETGSPEALSPEAAAIYTSLLRLDAEGTPNRSNNESLEKRPDGRT